MKIRFLGAIALAAVTLSATPTTYQATYQNGPNNDGTYIVGLSYVTLAGHGNFDAMCIDFQDEIHNGQTYQATVTPLADMSVNPDVQARYDMEGFIYLAMHNIPAVQAALPGISSTEALDGLQYAAWDLFDSNEAVDGNIYHGFAYTKQVNGAVDFALSHPGALDAFVGGLQHKYPGGLNNLYVVQGYGSDGNVQKFIIGGGPCLSTAGTPEPGSLALMGSGLIGIAVLIRKRRTLAQ